VPDRYFSCRKADALSVVRAADCPTVSAAKWTRRKPILSYAVSHCVTSKEVLAVQVLLVNAESGTMPKPAVGLPAVRT
jgi:hypothetical protein